MAERTACHQAMEIMRMKYPSELFTGDAAALKKEMRDLGKKWHPDVNGGSLESQKVMAHILELFDKGVKMIEEGRWETPDLLRIPIKAKGVAEIKYKKAFPFELGMAYIGEGLVAYVIDEKHKKLYENAIAAISSFRFSSDNMGVEISRYLPHVKGTFQARDGSYVLVLNKNPDLIRLRDALEYLGNKYDPKHAAWVCSSLYNIACYLDYSDLSHNALTLDTCFISPSFHSVVVLGGWWYATPVGEKMISAPSEVFSIMPPDVRTSKLGSIHTDLESIRAIGRELLGDRHGSKLTSVSGAPGPITEWMLGATSGKAVTDYTGWGEALTAGWGERKFIEMKLTADEVYPGVKTAKADH